jgi:hypothetical protein
MDILLTKTSLHLAEKCEYVSGYQYRSFTHVYSLPSTKNALAARVVVCGYDSKEFKQALEGLHNIDKLGAEKFGNNGGLYKRYSPAEYNGYPCIAARTPLLTPASLARDCVSIPFSRDIDPEGILERYRIGGLKAGKKSTFKAVHIQDNVVEYLKVEDIEDDGDT